MQTIIIVSDNHDWNGSIISINGEQYIVTSSTKTTLSIRKRNVFDRIYGWILSKINLVKSKISDFIGFFFPEPEQEYNEELD